MTTARMSDGAMLASKRRAEDVRRVRRSVQILAQGFRPERRDAFKIRRKPLVLVKGAAAGTARDTAARIADLVRVERRVRNVVAVLAHQDCDRVDPAHERLGSTIESTLQAADCPVPSIGVTPAWEIEAWWMVFPEAVAKVCDGWRAPDDWIGRDTGVVENAKEALAKAVQPRAVGKKARPRAYRESDSITIAQNIVAGGLLQSFGDGGRRTRRGSAEVITRSRSLERFRARLLDLDIP